MTEPGQSLDLPERSDAVLDFLSRRRSSLAKDMSGPGPDRAEVTTILSLASRVPDHRKLNPWRFVVHQGAAREALGEAFARGYAEDYPEADHVKLDLRRAKPLMAPTVIALIHSPKACRKNTPAWEQELATGAVGLALLNAARAHGYGAQWLTDGAYHQAVEAHLGLAEGERIAGFFYLGTTDTVPKERPRPDVDALVAWA